jgi:CRP-like cAMP-binding protein
MKEFIYGSGEVIFTQGDLDTRIFFIQQGNVELYIDLETVN